MVGSGINACSPRAQVQLIALARASWRFPRVAWLALFTLGERKFAGANWCQISLHCQFRITATITRGIQAVLSVERQYTAWNGVIPGPFYRGIPSLTIVYHGKPLSFSTRGSITFSWYSTCFLTFSVVPNPLKCSGTF